MTNLASVLKSRDLTLPTNIHIVKAMVFPVVTYCESWIVKKAECQRIDAFGMPLACLCLQTVRLEKTPESPLDSKEIKLVNLKGNKP